MTSNFLLRKYITVRNIGFVRSLRIIIDQLFLKVLQFFFGFDNWHSSSPISKRPYRKTVASVINPLQPKTVVEVGCGLGSVLSLIKANYRYGYDLDEGVIRAARFIRGKKIKFIHGDVNAINDDAIDVLIMVNWIHEYSPEQLAVWLEILLPRVRFLLLDSIDQDNPLNYQYCHDFSFLIGKAIKISDVRPPDEGRHFVLFKVIH